MHRTCPPTSFFPEMFEVVIQPFLLSRAKLDPADSIRPDLSTRVRGLCEGGSTKKKKSGSFQGGHFAENQPKSNSNRATEQEKWEHQCYQIIFRTIFSQQRCSAASFSILFLFQAASFCFRAPINPGPRN